MGEFASPGYGRQLVPTLSAKGIRRSYFLFRL
jgi:hypothetical protein